MIGLEQCEWNSNKFELITLRIRAYSIDWFITGKIQICINVICVLISFRSVMLTGDLIFFRNLHTHLLFINLFIWFIYSAKQISDIHGEFAACLSVLHHSTCREMASLLFGSRGQEFVNYYVFGDFRCLYLYNLNWLLQTQF